MTALETRCVMTQIAMPMHANGVAGVMFGGVTMPWIDVRRHERLRAAGRPEGVRPA